jgi:CRP-like cAMP-binding protein
MLRAAPIGENRLLKQLGADDFLALQPKLKKFSMTRGAVLHSSMSVIEHVYFPLSGMVSLDTVMSTGEQIVTAIVGREGVIGASIAGLGPNSFCTQATVQIPGMAWRIKSDRFLKMFDASVAFRKLINEFRADILLQTQQSAACNALHTVEARLCRWLLHSEDVVGSDTLQLTQEVISHMLGVQRPSVSLCAEALHNRGLIEYSRGNIKILDRGGLEKCACECYSVVRDHVNRTSKLNYSVSR